MNRNAPKKRKDTEGDFSEQITFRLTKEMKERIEFAASESQMTPAAWVRRACMSELDRPHSFEERLSSYDMLIQHNTAEIARLTNLCTLLELKMKRVEEDVEDWKMTRKGTSTIYSKSIDDTHGHTPIKYKITSAFPLEKRSTLPENPNIHTSIEDHYEVGHSKKQNNSHVDYLTNIAYPIRKKLDKL